MSSVLAAVFLVVAVFEASPASMVAATADPATASIVTVVVTPLAGVTMGPSAGVLGAVWGLLVPILAGRALTLWGGRS